MFTELMQQARYCVHIPEKWGVRWAKKGKKRNKNVEWGMLAESIHGKIFPYIPNKGFLLASSWQEIRLSSYL